MPKANLSFRTQMLLIFVFCLALAGTGMIFLNSYHIATLKDRMREKAVLLALEEGHRIGHELAGLLDNRGPAETEKNPDPALLDRRLEIIFERSNEVLAACLVDEDGSILVSDMGNNRDLLSLTEDEDGFEAEIRAGDFDNVRLRLRNRRMETTTEEITIERPDGTMAGRLRLLIRQNPTYSDIETASAEITRLLWSGLLAFVGVLALGFYLMARLLRHQLHLMADNERLDRMAYVGTLASGLAHEIRNPLNAMAMNLTIAEEEIGAGESGSPETVQRALRILEREVERVGRSVSSFMAFARPETESREHTDLRPIVGEVLEMLHPQVEACNVEVRIEMPDDALVLADFSGLRQVLYNIILNALQALETSDESPRKLSIGARRESAQWYLWIEDNGPGIPEDELEKVFEVFHTTKAAGSGFGLSIARAIIENHDGDVRARPAEGRCGTRFEILLPETRAKTRRTRTAEA